MAFSSIPFLFAFLPIALIFYRIMPAKGRAALLVVLSLLFYAWGDITHLPILLFSTVFTYVAGMEIGLFKARGERWLARRAMIVSVAVQVLLLGFYKYTDFILGNLTALFGRDPVQSGVSLPIGISFFTFSAISYLADIYMDRAEPEANPIFAAAYITFFPKLISGPIAQFRDMQNQFFAPRMTKQGVLAGTQRFLVGLYKKVLLADNLGAAYAGVQALDTMSAGSAWLAMIYYSLQLFFDFSGYSDMAIGLAQMLGFRMDQNFDYPYASDGMADFWRRWHISLGAWFRDYVYIPLGGNRCSRNRQIFNLIVVWLLTGFWHGAAWTFIFWGIWHGFFVIVERFLFRDIRPMIPRAVRIAVTVLIAFFGWVFFASPSMGYAFHWIGQMFGSDGLGFWNATTGYFFRSTVLLLILSALCCMPGFGKLMNKLSWRSGKAGVWISAIVYVLLLICSIAYIVGSSYVSFLYFAF